MADVYKGLTIKFGADTTGLSAALRKINKESGSLNAELRKVDNALKFNPGNTELVRQKQDLLARQIVTTKKRLDALNQANAKLGKEDIGTDAYNNLQREIVETTSKLNRLEDKAKQAKRATLFTDDEIQKLKRAGVTIAAAGLAIGTVAVGLGTKAAVAAADFEQAMSQVSASTGAPAAQMQTLSDLALKLGEDTVFSAGEAADAMLELAKSGMTPAQIEAGGLSATLQLAAAGGVDLADAAVATSNALNMFGLPANKAARVANALAGGANASSASVESLQQALSQVGPGAKNAGLTLNDTVGVLAAFADKGVQGSDAGTSLKTMLTRLVPATDKAAQSMEQYGLSFVDSKGNIDDITTVAQKLQDKLGGLSEEQRIAAMTTIFGSDATRAATILMEEGAAGVEKYIKATQDQTAAQEMADAKMSGLKGEYEELTGSIETAGIRIGQKMSPALEDMIDGATTFVNDWAPKLADSLEQAADKAVELGTEIKNALNDPAVQAQLETTGILLANLRGESEATDEQMNGITWPQAFASAMAGLANGVAIANINSGILDTTLGFLNISALAIISPFRTAKDTLNDTRVQAQRLTSGLKNLRDGATRLIDSIPGVNSRWASRIGDWMTALINSLIDSLNLAIRAYNKLPTKNISTIPRIGGGSTSRSSTSGAIGRIPLASGGSFAPNSPVPAIVGDQRRGFEHVLRDDQIVSLMQRAIGGGTREVHQHFHQPIQSYPDMRRAAREILEEAAWS